MGSFWCGTAIIIFTTYHKITLQWAKHSELFYEIFTHCVRRMYAKVWVFYFIQPHFSDGYSHEDCLISNKTITLKNRTLVQCTEYCFLNVLSSPLPWDLSAITAQVGVKRGKKTIIKQQSHKLIKNSTVIISEKGSRKRNVEKTHTPAGANESST